MQSLSLKVSLQLLGVPELSRTVFVWPDDSSTWLQEQGGVWLHRHCWLAATHQTPAEKGSLKLLPKQNQCFYPQSNSTGYVVERITALLVCWQKAQMENTSTISQLCLQHYSLQFVLCFADFVKHLKRQGLSDSQREPISPSKSGRFSLFSSRMFAIPGM